MYKYTKNIFLRPVCCDDASFVYEMRTNHVKSRYLSDVQGGVREQEKWIENYKKREAEGLEFYFVIILSGKSVGLVRVYDLLPTSFCWGSWMIKDGSPTYVSIESALSVYEFGFNDLGFDRSHFDVRKENARVIAFHKRFGAEIVSEDHENYYFSFTKEQYESVKGRYRKFF